MGSKFTYFMGIGSHCDAFRTWFRRTNCWGTWFWGINFRGAWFWRITCRGTCCRSRFRHKGWSFVTVNEDTKLVNFSTSARSIVTSPRSSWTSCSSWSIFCVCTSVCICEPNLDEDIGPLHWWKDLLLRRHKVRHGLRNYECKMMHDMLMQKDFFFLFWRTYQS